MGINSNNINGNYAIAEDGTIKRPYSELDTAMLNIIRVGANKDDILAAYKARKKCYQLCKESANIIRIKKTETVCEKRYKQSSHFIPFHP